MEVTLLKEEQIFGKNRLKIFDEYGTKAAITDFAILLGGFVSNHYYYNNSNSLEDRTGFYWTSSDDKLNDTRVVYENGYRFLFNVYKRHVGVRPALPYSSISSNVSNIVKVKNGILEVEYGEYPQYITKNVLDLDRAFFTQKLKKTGKFYTTDSVANIYYNTPFLSRSHIEYEYIGKKYIKIIENLDALDSSLSDGKSVIKGGVYWVEVSPIKWLVDVEKDIAISKNILVSGIQFDNKLKYNGNFEETFMYKYLNTIFIKDIQVQPKEIEISVIEEKSEKELALEKLDKDKQKILSLKNRLIK